MYQNWLSEEWVTGATGINAISAVDTTSGSFTMDALNLAQKVYNMLNRIAVSGGSFDDWQQAVYGEESIRKSETPMYVGGMSAEIIFDEVISTASTENNDLGALAGRGTITNKQGGQIEIKINEPSYIIGIVSITPRIDYTQGNHWHLTELTSLDDLHKPALDGIGFQDIVSSELAWFGRCQAEEDTEFINPGIGKVPAWIHYMTAVNENYGDFADENKAQWMTLCRKYEVIPLQNTPTRFDNAINDVTTYINPTKYNYTFADTSLEAQNFWVQIGITAFARRKMSAKIIPNL